MRTITCALLALLTVIAAGDDWKKLSELKTGTDLKIYERGSTQPRQAKFSDFTDDSLLVLVKNTEVAIPKDKIDRIDCRSPRKSGMKVDSQVKQDNPAQASPADRQGPTQPLHTDSGLPSYSTSSNVSFGSGDYWTIYRRAASPPPAK